MAMTSCIIPASGKPIFEIAEQDMEVGMGIHGETRYAARTHFTRR